MNWETLDVEALLNRREEQTGSGAAGGGGGTTSANVGAYTVPLGQPLRRKFPTSSPQYKALDKDYRTKTEESDAEYQWALGMIGTGF